MTDAERQVWRAEQAAIEQERERRLQERCACGEICLLDLGVNPYLALVHSTEGCRD